MRSDDITCWKNSRLVKLLIIQTLFCKEDATISREIDPILMNVTRYVSFRIIPNDAGGKHGKPSTEGKSFELLRAAKLLLALRTFPGEEVARTNGSFRSWFIGFGWKIENLRTLRWLYSVHVPTCLCVCSVNLVSNRSSLVRRRSSNDIDGWYVA